MSNPGLHVKETLRPFVRKNVLLQMDKITKGRKLLFVFERCLGEVVGIHLSS